MRPKVLFANEISANLDPQTGIKITNLLFELNAEYQTTLGLVTHDQALAQRCQKSLILNAGQLVT